MIISQCRTFDFHLSYVKFFFKKKQVFKKWSNYLKQESKNPIIRKKRAIIWKTKQLSKKESKKYNYSYSMQNKQSYQHKHFMLVLTSPCIMHLDYKYQDRLLVMVYRCALAQKYEDRSWYTIWNKYYISNKYVLANDRSNHKCHCKHHHIMIERYL